MQCCFLISCSCLVKRSISSHVFRFQRNSSIPNILNKSNLGKIFNQIEFPTQFHKFPWRVLKKNPFNLPPWSGMGRFAHGMEHPGVWLITANGDFHTAIRWIVSFYCGFPQRSLRIVLWWWKGSSCSTARVVVCFFFFGIVIKNGITLCMPCVSAPYLYMALMESLFHLWLQFSSGLQWIYKKKYDPRSH